MSGLNEFRVQQIVDNGRTVQISLAENVHTEPISQRQIVMEKVAKRLDGEARAQIMPLLDIILQSQPQMKLRTYHHTTVTVSMPRNRYDRMGRPQVGQIMEIDMSVRPARKGIVAAGSPFILPAGGRGGQNGAASGGGGGGGASQPGPRQGQEGRAEGDEASGGGGGGASQPGPRQGQEGRAEGDEASGGGGGGASQPGPRQEQEGRAEGDEASGGGGGAPAC